MIGKTLLFEEHLQKSTPDKLANRCIQTTTPITTNNAHGRIAFPAPLRSRPQHELAINSKCPSSSPLTNTANDTISRGESKYFQNIVANTVDKSNLLSSSNDLNVQINRASPIKSVKLLNNLNALKLK